MAKKKCGIYKITGPNGRVYVGQTKDLWSRWNDHVEALNADKHTNPHLQNAWNAYRPASFSFELIEEVYWCEETLDAREAYWGEKLDALTKGYNAKPFNASPDGGKNLFSKPKFATHPTTGRDLLLHILRQSNKSAEH